MGTWHQGPIREAGLHKVISFLLWTDPKYQTLNISIWSEPYSKVMSRALPKWVVLSVDRVCLVSVPVPRWVADWSDSGELCLGVSRCPCGPFHAIPCRFLRIQMGPHHRLLFDELLTWSSNQNWACRPRSWSCPGLPLPVFEASICEPGPAALFQER